MTLLGRGSCLYQVCPEISEFLDSRTRNNRYMIPDFDLFTVLWLRAIRLWGTSFSVMRSVPFPCLFLVHFLAWCSLLVSVPFGPLWPSSSSSSPLPLWTFPHVMVVASQTASPRPMDVPDFKPLGVAPNNRFSLKIMPGYCPVIIHGFPFPWKNHCLKPQKIWGLMRAVDCPECLANWLSSSLLHLTRVWLAALYSLSLFLFLPEPCLILGKRFPKLFLYFSCWGTVSFFLFKSVLH